MFNLRFVLLVLSCSSFAATFKTSLEGYAVGTQTNWQDSLLNPGNQVLKIQEAAGALDLRPEATFETADESLVARPRLLVKNDDPRLSVQLYELYGTANVSPYLSVTSGLQNFQWGPAEMLSPSQALIHQDPNGRSVLFRQRGKIQLRTSWLLSDSLNAVFLIEPIHNQEDLWISDVDYNPRGLVKIEKKFSGANYIGLTGGVAEGFAGFLGQYANAYLTDFFSAYADIRETQGSRAYYPSRLSSGAIDFQRTELGSKKIYTLMTIGARYESTVDVRLEYIYNGYGYDSSTLKTALSGALLSPANTRHFLRPGLELLEKHYLYFSARSDKLGPSDTLRLALRYLLSLQDGSGSLGNSTEWSFSDNFTLIFEPTLFYGGTFSSFKQGQSWQLLLALRGVL